MRDEVLLPAITRDGNASSPITDVETGRRLPLWHCPFLIEQRDGSTVCCPVHAEEASISNRSHESELWEHIRTEPHDTVFRIICKKYKLRESESRTHKTQDKSMNLQDYLDNVYLTLFNAALAEKD